MNFIQYRGQFHQPNVVAITFVILFHQHFQYEITIIIYLLFCKPLVRFCTLTHLGEKVCAKKVADFTKLVYK